MSRGSYLRLDFKGPAPSLTQAEHEKFRRQQAPTIVLMFWTSVVSFSPWQVFRTVLCFAEVDRNPPTRRNTQKAAFAKCGPEFNKKKPWKNRCLKNPPDSCLKNPPVRRKTLYIKKIFSLNTPFCAQRVVRGIVCRARRSSLVPSSAFSLGACGSA